MEIDMRHMAFEKFIGASALTLGLIMLVSMYV